MTNVLILDMFQVIIHTEDFSDFFQTQKINNVWTTWAEKSFLESSNTVKLIARGFFFRNIKALIKHCTVYKNSKIAIYYTIRFYYSKNTALIAVFFPFKSTVHWKKLAVCKVSKWRWQKSWSWDLTPLNM